MWFCFVVSRLYHGRALSQRNKNDLKQLLVDISGVRQLLQYFAEKDLLQTDKDREELSCKIEGVLLLQDYLLTVQFFCSIKYLPETAEGVTAKLKLFKKDEYDDRYVFLTFLSLLKQ